MNKGRFCNNSKTDTLISRRLSVKNKAKLSQLEKVNKQCLGGGFFESLLQNLLLLLTWGLSLILLAKSCQQRYSQSVLPENTDIISMKDHQNFAENLKNSLGRTGSYFLTSCQGGILVISGYLSMNKITIHDLDSK